MTKKIIIVDLDGTLCNADHRKHLVENKNWNAFYENLVKDLPNNWCLNILDRFKLSEIIFVSGRPEQYRKITREWLVKFGYASPLLFMRKDGDFRKDAIIKEEIYREHIEPDYEVMFCIDDRKQVVDMWRSIGLTCLQCAEGNF